MCAIIGALLFDINSGDKLLAVNSILKLIWEKSHERGRDGRGFIINSDVHENVSALHDSTRFAGENLAPGLFTFCKNAAIIGNLRAEPTTEYVKSKQLVDQQPYTVKDWSIVHNGTIANDKELRTGVIHTIIDSSAIAEQLAVINDFNIVIGDLRDY